MTENQLIPYNQLKEMATDVAKSQLFGCKRPEEAITLMLLSQAEGVHPMRAIQDFSIIQGRPAKKAEAIARDGEALGVSIKWLEYTDTAVEAEFSHPTGGTIKVRWTIEMASKIVTSEKEGKKLTLLDKDNWKNYPRAMLRSRCISEGMRTVCPRACSGMYTPEEVEMINVTPDNSDADKAQQKTLSKTEELKARQQAKKEVQEEAHVVIEVEPQEAQDDGVDTTDYSRTLNEEEVKDLIKLFSEEGQDIRLYLSNLTKTAGYAINLKNMTLGQYNEAKAILGRA